MECVIERVKMPVTGRSEVLPTIDECSAKTKDHYKLVVLGDAKVGKTSIIHRFLYDKMPAKYSATVEEFHQGEFDLNGELSCDERRT